MATTIEGVCVYCNTETQVKLWKETKEMVCFECRLGMLESEYERYAHDEDDLEELVSVQEVF